MVIEGHKWERGRTHRTLVVFHGHPKENTMATLASTANTECEYTIDGEFDLNSSAAVIATRGTGITVTKTGTGTYTVVLANRWGIQLVELINRWAGFSGTQPVTATGIFVGAVTQASSQVAGNAGDITINITTTLNPQGGAATDTTGATTVDFQVVFRTCKLVSPI